MSSQDLNSAKSTEPGELSRARRLFKNQNKNQEEMRRRRNVMSVEIRKSKREETVEKRRNIQMAPDGPESDIDSEMENSFQRLWNLSHSRDTMTRFSGIQQIRRALCSNMSPPIGEFIQAGFVKVLVNCLTEDSNPMLQFEAAWALTNISSGTTEQTSSVVDAGIVPHLIRLLERPLKLINMELTEQIIWCIGNIMGNGANSRIFLIANGLADLLTNMVVNSPKALPLACLKQLSWTMVNLTRISTVPNKLTDIAKWIPAYHILIDLEDPTVKSDIVWSLCYICDAGADYCQLLLENGFYPKFLQLLEHDEKKVRTAALRTVGTILSSTDAQTQVTI